MTTSPELLLAADIETAILAVPGVTTIFRTGSTASKVVDAGARLLGLRDDDAPLVRIEQAPEGFRVEVAIGVLASAGAVETAHRVHAAIEALTSQQRDGSAEIRITVVHVDDTGGATE
ncbi:hypothetical protein [Microbacterium sp. 18062]|uniref:hypothetical protein n=1 Tax=Microbacterium sp. 18062 TaxID=2681410 RepID=UPI001358F067|nr:hypothetical protein [Microbacterium sp. 18062]